MPTDQSAWPNCAIASNRASAPLILKPVINGAGAPRLPNTANIAFVGHDRQALFMALDLAGVYCSTGSACSSGSSEPSPTLVAMDLPREIVSSSLRFSLGATTTAAEIDEALRRIAERGPRRTGAKNWLRLIAPESRKSAFPNCLFPALGQGRKKALFSRQKPL